MNKTQIQYEKNTNTIQTQAPRQDIPLHHFHLTATKIYTMQIQYNYITMKIH